MIAIRRWLEASTRDMVFQRRLPAQFAHVPIYVTPSGGLKYLFHPVASVDPGLLSLAAEFVAAGATVWDVGANIGLFTIAAAQRAGPKGQVVAFDPDPWLAMLLNRSASIQPQGSAPVSILPVALANALGLRTFHFAARSRAANFLAGYGSTQTGGVRSEKLVMACTLDWLLDGLPAPSILKIDVEGAEWEVLQGGSKLLEMHRPVVLCEVASANSPAVTELLHTFGYRLYDGDLPANARVELVHATWNTIAIPDRLGRSSH